MKEPEAQLTHIALKLFLMKSDFYEILGLSHDANAEHITIAYRRLARQNHPDMGGDSEQFKKISEAYEVLSDPVKRMAYDKRYKVYINHETGVRLIMPLCKNKTHKELLDELVNTEWEIRR